MTRWIPRQVSMNEPSRSCKAAGLLTTTRRDVSEDRQATMDERKLIEEIDSRLDAISPDVMGVRVISIGKMSLEIALTLGNIASKDQIIGTLRKRCQQKYIFTTK